MPRCAICGLAVETSWPCQNAHPDHCHSCWELSLRGSLEAATHRAPEASLVLSPRDVQALVAYQQHVQRTVGVEGLVRLVTEEEAP